MIFKELSYMKDLNSLKKCVGSGTLVNLYCLITVDNNKIITI